MSREALASTGFAGSLNVVCVFMALSFCISLLSFLLPAVSAHARGVETIFADKSGNRINVHVGKSVIIQTPQPIKRLALAGENIADYVLLSPNQIYLTGKNSGLTNLTLWGTDDRVSIIYDIEVSPDVSRLREKLHQLLPQEKNLRVHASHNALTLSGSVNSTASLDKAMAIANAYRSDQDQSIINLLDVSGVHQVMLEVRVSEMSRSLGRRLGINFVVGSQGSIGTSLVGNLATIEEFIGSGRAGSLELEFSETINSLFHIAAGNVIFTQFMDALKEEGLIRVLAEPNLITLSGQTASFLAGGEFPVPVPQGLGTVGIEYKPFGVALSFTPTVLSDDKIHLKVMPEVSELDFTTAVSIQGVAVPGITTRQVSTTIELADGQSFAIAGLLRDSMRENVKKFPFLGDIPILGALFRSSSFQRNETELVVIVTPHLVRPLDMARQKLPTDGYVMPSDTEFYLMGLMQGRSPAAKSSPPSPMQGTVEGPFGHVVPGF